MQIMDQIVSKYVSMLETICFPVRNTLFHYLGQSGTAVNRKLSSE